MDRVVFVQRVWSSELRAAGCCCPIGAGRKIRTHVGNTLTCAVDKYLAPGASVAFAVHHRIDRELAM